MALVALISKAPGAWVPQHLVQADLWLNFGTANGTVLHQLEKVGGSTGWLLEGMELGQGAHPSARVCTAPASAREDVCGAPAELAQRSC